MNDYTWEEYQQFIQENSLKLEEEKGELKLYHYFDTLQWKYCYSIILKNTFISCSFEYPYSDFELAKDVYLLMKDS